MPKYAQAPVLVKAILCAPMYSWFLEFSSVQSLGVRRVGAWSAQGERLRIQDSGHHAHPDRACSAGANTCLSTLALGYLQSPPFIFGFFLFL